MFQPRGSEGIFYRLKVVTATCFPLVGEGALVLDMPPAGYRPALVPAFLDKGFIPATF
jgi:hypothetical protein